MSDRGYPDGKYAPSCLLCGKTDKGRDLHIQVSVPPDVVIITIYEPDPAEYLIIISEGDFKCSAFLGELKQEKEE